MCKPKRMCQSALCSEISDAGGGGGWRVPGAGAQNHSDFRAEMDIRNLTYGAPNVTHICFSSLHAHVKVFSREQTFNWDQTKRPACHSSHRSIFI